MYVPQVCFPLFLQLFEVQLSLLFPELEFELLFNFFALLLDLWEVLEIFLGQLSHLLSVDLYTETNIFPLHWTYFRSFARRQAFEKLGARLLTFVLGGWRGLQRVVKLLRGFILNRPTAAFHHGFADLSELLSTLDRALGLGTDVGAGVHLRVSTHQRGHGLPS